jgi:hypothetical protein
VIEEIARMRRRRRRRWSLLNRGDPLNTQHAQHRPKPRSDESLALCHPYLQLRYSVHPHRPACAQQDGENFPIGADPSGSILALS